MAIAARRLVVNSPTRSTVDHPFARQFVGVLVPPSSIARRPFARSLAHAVALAPLRSYTVGARSEETIKCRPGPKSYLVCPNQHHQLNLLGGDSFFFSAQIRPLSEFLVSLTFYVPRVHISVGVVQIHRKGSVLPSTALMWRHSLELPNQQQCAGRCRPG